MSFFERGSCLVVLMFATLVGTACSDQEHRPALPRIPPRSLTVNEDQPIVIRPLVGVDGDGATLRIVAATAPGKTVTLGILRDGQVVTLQLTLGTRPEDS